MTDRELLIRMDGKLTTGFTTLFQAHSTLVDQGRDHDPDVEGTGLLLVCHLEPSLRRR